MPSVGDDISVVLLDELRGLSGTLEHAEFAVFQILSSHFRDVRFDSDKKRFVCSMQEYSLPGDLSVAFERRVSKRLIPCVTRSASWPVDKERRVYRSRKRGTFPVEFLPKDLEFWHDNGYSADGVYYSLRSRYSTLGVAGTTAKGTPIVYIGSLPSEKGGEVVVNVELNPGEITYAAIEMRRYT